MAVNQALTRFPVAAIGVIALVVNACGGAVPTTSTVVGAGSGASEVPSLSPASGGLIGSSGPGGSGVPDGSGGPGAADVTIVADETTFTTTDVSAPAGKPFTILFQNKDPSTFHDIDIMAPDGGSKIIFDGALVYGPKDKTYDVPALSAGTYKFVCSVHPGQMTGTLTAG
jgi:plastocyanin